MRMWEIRENTEKTGKERPGHYTGYRSKTIEEAYECGYEDGYEEAMKELEEKSSYRRMR